MDTTKTQKPTNRQTQMRKAKLRKIVSIVLIVAIVINLALFALTFINPLQFWIIILVVFILTKIVLRK